MGYTIETKHDTTQWNTLISAITSGGGGGGSSHTHSRILNVFDDNEGNGWRGSSGSFVAISNTHNFTITKNGLYMIKTHLTKAQGTSTGSGQFKTMIDGVEINNTNDSRRGRGTIFLSNLSSSYEESINFVDLSIGTHNVSVELVIAGTSDFYVGGTSIDIISMC